MKELSSAMVDASLSSAFGAITYEHLKPRHPNYPFPEGGFWAEFTSRLEGRYESINEETEETVQKKHPSMRQATL